MTKNLFTHNQFYIQFKAPNSDELISYVMDKGEEYCEMSWAKECNLKTITCPWQEIGELIHPSVHLFSQHLGKPFDYQYDDGWINCYERGFYQEIHGHAEYDFVSVFFPQNQEDGFSKLYFYDRYGNSLNPSWEQIFNLSPSWEPHVSAGDIIFFPGSVLHGVTLHKSDKIRKSFSCNYKFNLKQSTE